jgi:hypothetical protein
MAYPATRLTTYLASSVPRIKADDLNKLQDSWANFLTATSPTLTGGWTMKGPLHLDGVGGNATPAGTVLNDGGNTNPFVALKTSGGTLLGGADRFGWPQNRPSLQFRENWMAYWDTGLFTAWSRNTAYVVGQLVYSNGSIYFCCVAGTSAVGGSGPIGVSSGGSTPITDNGAKWTWISSFPGNASPWNVVTATLGLPNVANAISGAGPGGAVPFPALFVIPGNQNTNDLYVVTGAIGANGFSGSGLRSGGVFYANSTVSNYIKLAAEWIASIDTGGANSTTWAMGFGTTGFAPSSVFATALNMIGFLKRSGDTNWQAVVGNTPYDTGVAPGNGTFHRFRIEYTHGPQAGNYYPTFYIDDVPVVQGPFAIGGVPPNVAAMMLGFGGYRTGSTGGSPTLTVGPVSLCANVGLNGNPL